MSAKRLYKYLCKCGEQFEKRQEKAQRKWAACPQCGREAAKVFTPPTVLFRGAGFYSSTKRTGSKLTGAQDTVTVGDDGAPVG